MERPAGTCSSSNTRPDDQPATGHDEQELTMSNATRLRRSAILGALAFALLERPPAASPTRRHRRRAHRQSAGAGALLRPPQHPAQSDPPRSDDSPRLTAAQLRARALLLVLWRARADRRSGHAGAGRRHPLADHRAHRRRRTRRRVGRRHPSPPAAAPPPRRPRRDVTHPGARLDQAGASLTSRRARR